jgi:tRNA/rRNA methyltransferase
MPPALRCLDRIAIVLVRTSHPGNVGAAARAMRVMGLSQLRLVAPRFADVLGRDEAVAFASGATDVLAAARVYPTLEAAIADASLAVAVSAEAREFAGPVADPYDCAAAALAELETHPAHRVAFVFGSERVGLSIGQAQRCQMLTSIPTDASYSSLNLAQAVQVIAYCLRRAALEAAAAPPASDGAGSRLADQEAIAGLFDHLERALVAVEYLDPRHPKKLMPRLRRLFSRARLEEEEIDLLRGICKKMERSGRGSRSGDE